MGRRATTETKTTQIAAGQNGSAADYRSGLIASIGCMALWGVLPIYWKALVPISSWVIIIYRILLVNVFAMLLARTRFSWKEIFGPIRADRKLALKFLGAGGGHHDQLEHVYLGGQCEPRNRGKHRILYRAADGLRVRDDLFQGEADEI